MAGIMWLGIAMLAAYVVLFLQALPRRGQVRPFLRGEGLSSAYAVALVALLLGGVALIVTSWM